MVNQISKSSKKTCDDPQKVQKKNNMQEVIIYRVFLLHSELNIAT